MNHLIAYSRSITKFTANLWGLPLRGFPISVLVVAVCMCAGQTRAEDSPTSYESLFGREEKSVLVTTDKADDVAFAVKLLNSAGRLKEDVALRALLYERAYDFGIKDPSGYSTAIQAIRLLSEVVPDRRSECDDKLLAVFRLPYRKATGVDRTQTGANLIDQLLVIADRQLASGQAPEAIRRYQEAVAVAADIRSNRLDELKSKLRDAQLAQRIQTLKGQLAATPGDKLVATQLTMLYVTDVNAPSEAARVVEATGDDELQKRVMLATKSPDDVTEEEASELAQWYLQVAGKASAPAKRAMLVRAQTYCERFLSLHSAEDAYRLKIVLMRDDVERQLGASAESVAVSGSNTGGEERQPASISKAQSPSTVRTSPARSSTARKPTKLPSVISEELVVGGPDVLIVAEATVTVTERGSLTISPGSLLEFAPDANLIISGHFRAVGEEANPIVFTARDKSLGWSGIRMERSGSKKMSWCVVTRAKHGLWILGHVDVDCSAFVYNHMGLMLYSSSGSYTNCVISHSLDLGVLGGEDHNSKWTHVSITDNLKVGYFGGFKGWPIMTKCDITRNRQGGIKGAQASRPEISDSNIYGNGEYDIECAGDRNYELTGIFVGEAAARILSKDDTARVPNILDRRTPGRTGGVVVIKSIREKPVEDAGAPKAVRDMAAAFVPKK